MGDAHRSEGRPNTFLVEVAAALGDDIDAPVFASHARSCPTCVQAEAERREVDELLLALADAEHLPSAPPLAELMAASRRRRRPAPAVPTFAVPFATAAGMLEAVLTEVGDDVLRQPSPVLAWRLGDLVPHLAAGNALLAAAIGLPFEPAPTAATDLIGHTERLLTWVAGWPRDRVQAMWRRNVDAIAAHLRAQPELASRHVEVDGVRMTVAAQLVVRAFETWIHARDIGAAAGLRLPPPPAESLAAMADLVARLLSTLPSRSATAPTGSVRLTLTGPGGGSWLVHVGGADASPAPVPEAELTLDTVDFCLLVADRAPAHPQVTLVGDEALAAELLAVAPQLARP
jgi:uncharacterized protein (TIGR03083 family)